MKLLPNPYGLMATRHDTTEDADDNAAYLPALTHECAQAGLDLQLTDDSAADLPEIKVIDGQRVLVARSDELGVALDEVRHGLGRERTELADETRITALAAALYVANATYAEALKMPNPAATLDDICDALPEVMPEVLAVVKTTPEGAEVLKSSIADLMWAYTAVEHARTEAGDGYGWIFDLLVEALEKGGNPHTIRADALAVPSRIREIAELAGGDE